MEQPRGTSAHLRPSSELRLPRIAVAVLRGRYRGALAHALDLALWQPSTIVLVHLEGEGQSPGSLPLAVVSPAGPADEALLSTSEEVDTLVVEVGGEAADELDPRLVRLRRDTRCAVIEVDAAGDVVRVSTPSASLVPSP